MALGGGKLEAANTGTIIMLFGPAMLTIGIRRTNFQGVLGCAHTLGRLLHAAACRLQKAVRVSHRMLMSTVGLRYLGP